MEPNTDLIIPPLPETHLEDLLGRKLIKKRSNLTDKDRETKFITEECDLTEIGSDAKFVLLFFSAGWCYPCNDFMQVLKDFYSEVNIDSKQIEIVFVSSDNDEASFKESYAKMPWLTFPYSSAKHAELKQRF